MFYNNTDAILQSKGKVVYVAVCISAQVLEQQLLRQQQIIAAYSEVLASAKSENPNNKLDIKQEFHCTLQFFTPPRDPVSVDEVSSLKNEKEGNLSIISNSSDHDLRALLSLVGQQVQMSIAYVALTPKIIAARLNILSPTCVAVACGNSCPHITLAVGNLAQAVWSNELLCFVEGKVLPSASSNDAKSGGAYQRRAEELWSKAKIVSFSENAFLSVNDCGDDTISNNKAKSGSEGGAFDSSKNYSGAHLRGTTMTTTMMITGQVCAYVQVPTCSQHLTKNSNRSNQERTPPAVSPRLMSPSCVSPSSASANEVANDDVHGVKMKRKISVAGSRSTTPTAALPVGGKRSPGRQRQPHKVQQFDNDSDNGEAVASTATGQQHQLNLNSLQEQPHGNESPTLSSPNGRFAGNTESPMRRESTLSG